MASDASRSPIPRVLHWLWLGPSEVPDIFRYYIESWRRHHPTWETHLWREETLPALACQAQYQAAAFKTRYDITRLELLRQFGGVIVDMDVEAVRPLDPLLRGVSAFVGAIGGRHVGNQVLGAVPRHPLFEHAVSKLASTLGSRNASTRAGKTLLRETLAERPDGVTVFPAETFYHEPSFDPPRRPDDFPNVYAVHHQLSSYSVLPKPGEVEGLARRLITEAEALAATAGSDPAEAVAEARERFDTAGRDLLKALRQQVRGHAAAVKQASAQREQALAQLEEARRQLAALARDA